MRRRQDLYQGIANGIGMAISEAHMSKIRKRDHEPLHYILCGDGCLMEGVRLRSLAGHLPVCLSMMTTLLLMARLIWLFQKM